MSKSFQDGRTRRQFLAETAAVAAIAGVSAWPGIARSADADSLRAIGSRRELFIDDYLIERLEGQAEQRLQHPTPREVVLVHDAPWEGSGSGYHSVFRDGDLYRMYYKAWHLEVTENRLRTDAHPLYCCYAESRDGIHWEKPSLGLHEFRGSKDNNIVLVSGPWNGAKVDAGHPAVFKDENPDAPAAGRYKAIVRSSGPKGLLPLQSADGLYWSLMSEQPVITDGAFDSQNLAFWDSARGEYRAYWRYFTAGVADEKNWKPAGHRAIRTATSADFIHWSTPADLTYVDSPSEQLYTNQTKPYHRAPHLLLGFPTRYVERDWSAALESLPELEHRRQRSRASQRYGTALTEALVMASRDGVKFKRWNEAFVRPGVERPGTWHYGQQYLAWHVVETAASLPGAPPELSFYASENYWTGDSSELRRYSLRLDGFVSIQAPMRGGELITRPLTFTGSRLTLNFASSAAGGLRVELQEPSGRPYEGRSLEDCAELFGDAIDREVTWKSGPDVSALAGKPVRLRIALKDADLYSLQFAK